MNQLKQILEDKQKRERREILLESLKEMEKELTLWHSWLVLNSGEFSRIQVEYSLRRAMGIVKELLLFKD